MKCLGLDISRPLFEFLTSLSRQPPLVIQYNGCQRPSVSTRGKYGCKDAVQPSLAQFLDELRTWAASLGQAVQGCHEVPPRLICSSLGNILKKCGMYTIEAEIGLAQMQKALAEQYCEQQAENFVPADAPLSETWVLYHQRDTKPKPEPHASVPHSEARSKSPEPWVLYHQRTAESGADAREAECQTLDEVSCQQNTKQEQKRDVGHGADTGERRRGGASDGIAERPTSTVVDPVGKAEELGGAGKELEGRKKPDAVEELKARNSESLCTLMSDSQTWVLYHQREDTVAQAEAAPTAGTERLPAGGEQATAGEEDGRVVRMDATAAERETTDGRCASEAQRTADDDEDEDLTILEAASIQTRSAAQRKRRAGTPGDPPAKRVQIEASPQQAASSFQTETDKGGPTKSTSTSRGRRGKGSCGKPGQKLTLADLESQFGVIQKQAAKNLNVCATTLKRACRRHGIERWPRQETLEGGLVSVKSVAASEVTSQADSLADSAQNRASKSIRRPSREGAGRAATPAIPPCADPPLSEELEPLNLEVGPLSVFRSEPSFAELADFTVGEETAFHSVGGSLSEHTGPPANSSPGNNRPVTAGGTRLTAGSPQLSDGGGWGKQGTFGYASPPSPDMSTLLEEFLTSEGNPFNTQGAASDELDGNLFSSAMAAPDSSAGALSKGTVVQDAESVHGGSLYQDYQMMLAEPTQAGSIYTDSPNDTGPVFQEFQSMPSEPIQGHESTHAGPFYQPFQEMLHAPLEENMMVARSPRHPSLARAHSTTNMRSYGNQFMQPGMQFARSNVVYASPDGRSNWVRQSGPFPGGHMRRGITDERQHGVAFAFPPAPSTSGTYDGPGFF